MISSAEAAFEEYIWNKIKGFEVSISASRKILRILGIWTHPNKKDDFIFRCQYVVPTLFMFYFINMPQQIMLVKVWGDLNTVIEVLVTSHVPIGVAVVKMLGVRYNRHVLGRLVNAMADDWKSLKTYEELQIMWKNAKLSRLISITVTTLSLGSSFTFFLFNVTKRRFTFYNETNLRPLYFKSDFLYDIYESPRYELIWMFQCFSTFFAALAFASADAFFAVLMLHLCAQLNNLTASIKNIPEAATAKSHQSYRNVISTIVRRHEYLNEFASSVEDAFNFMFLVQIVASSVVLCLQGYQLIRITTDADSIPLIELVFMIYYTMTVGFSIFAYCYIAEILRTESLDVGNAAYECSWYNLTPQESKFLILLMIRAKEPLKITAGKFAVFSMELYCSILKSSGGYLSMLLAMRDRLIT